MRNKKGFTLIELLAVIVILAIIALIATPIVLNIIEKSRRSAFTRSAENVLKSANNHYAISLIDGEFEDISFECDGTKCLSNEIDNEGNQIDLNVEGSMGKGTVNISSNGNVEFELSNGAYCATKTVDSSKIEITKGNCGELDPKEDTTKPEIRNVSYTKTNNSIKIIVNAKDSESGINYYEYSIDDGATWTEKQTSNIYEYTNLSLGTYKIKVRVYNGAYDYKPEIGVIESEVKEVTLEVESCPIPTILSEEPTGWAQSKKITIDYGNIPGCTGSYSIDNGTTFIEGTEVTTNNKNIILKNTNVEKDFTASHSLKIDNEEPTLTIVEVTSDENSITINYTLEDNESGIKSTNCVAGTSENNYNITGTIENNKCILSNLNSSTTYYYKVTSTDNADNSTEKIGNITMESSIIQSAPSGKSGLLGIVYYNPVEGEVCTNYTSSQSVTGTKTGCMKWYVYKDNGDGTINMILDHNTTAKVTYNSSKSNSTCKEACTQLTSDTSDWKVSARMITKEEIEGITGGSNSHYFNGNSSNNQAANSNVYSWLFDYTSNCTSRGCNISDSSVTGYWTSTPYTGNDSFVFHVFYSGNLTTGSVTANYGLRPVITISK